MLASSSPRRRELLAELGVDFRVTHVHVDETLPGVGPEEAARLLAERKARSADVEPRATVVAGDTLVVTADGEILGKPRDEEDAVRILSSLGGTTHRVITGICVSRDEPPFHASDAVTTRVTMRALTEDEVRAYVATGESEGKARAYAIQEHGDRFVTRVDGSWSNVVGLPLERLGELLADAGVSS